MILLSHTAGSIPLKFSNSEKHYCKIGDVHNLEKFFPVYAKLSKHTNSVYQNIVSHKLPNCMQNAENFRFLTHKNNHTVVLVRQDYLI